LCDIHRSYHVNPRSSFR